MASPQTLADALRPLAPRRYSVASVPADGALQLIVRLERHADGLGITSGVASGVASGIALGIASGWLTTDAPIGSAIALRLLPNPAFAPTPDDVPCLFIGNGSGLAGLRSHLRARVRAGHRRNWLLFGERQAACDSLCADEIARWQAEGFLERLDRVFSRDIAGSAYVQDRLREAAGDVTAWIARGARLYVCGSLNGMASGVDAALVEILGRPAFDAFMAAGRYRRDVY